MRNLTNLHLGYVDSHALALLPMLSGSLRHLKLWYSIRPAQSTTTDDALLRALATHTRLQSLELMGFAPSEPFAHADAQYTSLRHLVLLRGNALSLQLLYRFPQLTTLAASVRGPTSTDPHVATASHWPPLKTLLIQSTLDRDIKKRIGRVDKLVLQQSMQPGELDAPLASQGALTGMAILRAASPVYLSLSVYLSLALMDALARVLADLPRLRMLDLQRVASTQNTMEPPLHEKLVECLSFIRGLQLVSLRLSVPIDLALFDSPTPHRPDLEQMDVDAEAEANATVPLHVRITQMMPELRVFCVLSEHGSGTDAPPYQWEGDDPSSTDDFEGTIAPWWYAPLWDKRYSEGRASEWYTRCWRVEESGGLTKVSWREAQEALRDIESSCM